MLYLMQYMSFKHIFAMCYVLCVVRYVLYIVQHVRISLVLSTFLETVLCTIGYRLYAISDAILELSIFLWF